MERDGERGWATWEQGCPLQVGTISMHRATPAPRNKKCMRLHPHPATVIPLSLPAKQLLHFGELHAGKDDSAGGGLAAVRGRIRLGCQPEVGYHLVWQGKWPRMAVSSST